MIVLNAQVMFRFCQKMSDFVAQSIQRLHWYGQQTMINTNKTHLPLTNWIKLETKNVSLSLIWFVNFFSDIMPSNYFSIIAASWQHMEAMYHMGCVMHWLSISTWVI